MPLLPPHRPELPPAPGLLGAALSAAAMVAAAMVAAAVLPAAASPSAWRTLPLPADQPPAAWRAISPAGAAPASRLIPADAGAPAAGVAIIPASAPVLRGQGPGVVEPGGPPADAQAVSAAPIRFPYLIRPSLGGGVPSGYVGGWGDYYIAGSAGTPGKQRGGSPDGSVNLGFAVGDPVRSLGIDFYWGIGSIKSFNANGSVGVSAGRILVNRPDLQVAVAGGLLDAYAYGNEPGKPAVNGYGAVTVALPLRPGDPSFPQRLQLSAGGGGNSFAAIDANFQTTEAGFFVAAGVDLLPNVGLSVGQSSRSTNVNLSWIPLRSLPIFVNLVAVDVFDSTPFGTVGVLSVGWGDSLQRGYFSN